MNMNRHYKNFLVWVVLWTLGANLALAQTTVTGKVVAQDTGDPLPGVTVLEKGTSNGGITDVDGNYSLSVGDGAVLLFSFVGYETQEIAVAGRSSVDVNMPVDIETLSEVVVIGYGEVDKDDLTGAISTLAEADFNQGVTTSPQELLTGRVAGVSVISAGGAPGSGTTIRIRGGSSLGGATNDPLIVIDGFPIDDGDVSGLSNPLNTLNPNDIESFTVLKDASAAAIYGSRAANGVIIITTKNGSADKLKVSLNSQFSIGQATKYVDVLSGDEYRQLISDLVNSEDGLSGVDEDVMLKLGDANTDWQEEIFQTAISHNHNLSVNGTAAGLIPFRASYGYTDQEGILKTTSTQRHSISLNLNPKLLNDDLKVNVNTKYTIAESNFGDEAAVGSAVRYDPTQPVQNGNTRYGGFFAYTDGILPDGSMDPESNANFFVTNPVAMLEFRDNTATVNRFTGNVQLDYSLPIDGLSANVNVGMDWAETDGQDNAAPELTWVNRDYEGDNGRIRNYTNVRQSELLETYAKYVKSFGNHNIDFTAGYSWQHFERESTTFDSNGDGSQVVEDSKFSSENFLVSFYGRLIYTLNDKYILTASLRQDGSSRFVEDNQWGIFPAAAFAWKINEESFLSGVTTLSTLKLRLGYGVTGQQGLSPDLNDAYYPALAKYTRSTIGASYQFGNQFYSTYRPEAYDANLKWEETTTYNIGLDFGLWQEKLAGSVEVYQKTTDDLLNRIPIADGSNFGNFLTTNVGSMEIKGYEVTLTARPVTTTNFSWNIGVNVTYNTREIIQLNKTEDPSDPGVPVGSFGRLGSNIQIHTVGQSPNAFYTFQQVYDANGNPIEGAYVDRTGNGGAVASNEFNKYHNGTPYADYLFGINSRLEYMNFDFSFSGRLSLGNRMYNSVLSGQTMANIYETSGTGYFANIQPQALEYGFSNPQNWSDIYVSDASFFRLDNISIGYNFEKIAMDRLNARISFTVQNAFLITNYEGLDPEIETGIDNNIYPRPRTYLLGLNLNF